MQKTFFWTALIAMIVIAAYLDARGISALVRDALAPDAPMLAHAVQVVEVVRVVEKPVMMHDAAIPAPEPPPAPADCDGLAVRAIAFADDPEVSLASIWDTRASQFAIRHRGDDVRGQSVAFIGRDRVYLARGDAFCQVSMYGPPQAAAIVKTPAKPVVSADPALAGVHRQSERDYVVDRALVERVLSDPSQVARLAQTIPEMVDGKMVGVRLKGVRADSLLGALGIVDGDRLEKVNGYDLTSTEKIFEAYAHLREADRITMQVLRGSSTLHFDYAIR